MYSLADPILKNLSIKSSSTSVSGNIEFADSCGMVRQVRVQVGAVAETLSATETQFEISDLQPCTNFDVIVKFV